MGLTLFGYRFGYALIFNFDFSSSLIQASSSFFSEQSHPFANEEGASCQPNNESSNEFSSDPDTVSF